LTRRCFGAPSLAVAVSGFHRSVELMTVDYDQIEKESKSLKTRFNEIYQ